MVLLIKASELTKNSPLGGSIDPDKYASCIWDAQMLHLEPLLGEALYDKIVSDFEDETLSGKYLELYTDYIKPFMIHQTASNYLLIGAYQINNGGIYKHTAENAESVTSNDINLLHSSQQSKADAYALRMKKWLCKSGNRLSEYYEFNQVVNRRSVSVGSFYAGKGIGKEDCMWGDPYQ